HLPISPRAANKFLDRIFHLNLDRVFNIKEGSSLPNAKPGIITPGWDFPQVNPKNWWRQSKSANRRNYAGSANGWRIWD
ncbi:MAG TPA: hypothetical protein V6D28_09385, partial [Leptolyngbyaceae cyanobacterium]